MKSSGLFIVVMLLCALRPLVSSKPETFAQPALQLEQNWAFERWMEGKKAVYPLPLTAVEQRFASGFPGEIGRFSDDQTIWVVRHIARPTRMLHPAIDCYRGLGYQVSTPRVMQQANNTRWQCFIAEREQKFRVCERIFDDKQAQWTDVSAWYWETLLASGFQSGKHEWWAITQVTQADTGDMQMAGR